KSRASVRPAPDPATGPSNRLLVRRTIMSNRSSRAASEKIFAAETLECRRMFTQVVQGTCFWDKDGNGLNFGDPGMSGTTVYADFNHNGALDAGEPNDVTDASGFFSLGSLVDGTYTIRPVSSAGFASNGTTATVQTTVGGKATVTVFVPSYEVTYT